LDFQKNLDRLTEWANTWQLSVSINKCCIMRVASRHRLDDVLLRQFVLCNTVLNYVDLINNLGILVDSHLTFEAHIDYIVQKAARRIYITFK